MIRSGCIAVSLLVAVGVVVGQQQEFPAGALLPKEETGAARFLAAHPEYDGRGVVVAIFDTGVDPGAPGMQITSDGRPKIVDMIDGSGSGDVPTTTVRTVEDGVLAGLSGRSLQVPSGWSNPSGDYHLGLKRGYELFPGGLVGRIKAKRKEAWDERQRAALADARRGLVAFDAAHAKPTREELKTRQDLQDRITLLETLQKNYDDPGPMYDCVVFHDGDTWRAVIDTDEDGDLGDERVLTNFRAERQFATFDQETLLNFAVNIYADGRLLSIVTDSGAHGTHVAGIVAAHFPDQPELNGIAPGAQIVAVKIGDTRLRSSSAGTGEIRGAIAALANECDLINMSYGGPTPSPNEGRIIDIYSEIVDRYGVIWCASAGNSGPALSTVGGPGGTTEALFGIGAAISPAMMDAQYALRESTQEMQYTWSSRGPTLDGAIGVKFSAPGGAIAPVPNWVLQRNMQMNGTSMAAPNACGGIALLLSGLKAEGIPYAPRHIRRAIENTTREIPGEPVFHVGAGMIQIDAAFAHLQAHRPYTQRDLRFEVSVAGRDGARGIYLREPHETRRVLQTNVRVTPAFHHDADNRDKVDFEMRVRLETDARWVGVADHLMLMHGGRSFEVRVDPTRLEPGLHYAEIRGFDSDDPERGPLFRIPVTVIQPRPVDAEAVPHWNSRLRFQPGQIARRFLAVPPGATWADVRISMVDADARRRLVLHTQQILPERAFDVRNRREYIWVEPGQPEVRTLPVVGGRTLEFCLAQYWSSLGEGTFDVEVSFHGLVPDTQDVALTDGGYSRMIDVVAPLQTETLAPAATLKTWRQTLRPEKHEIRPLDSVRDRLPENRQIYELILSYAFEQESDGDVLCRPALTRDPEAWDTWESQTYAVYDANKRLLGFGFEGSDPLELKKGGHHVRFHVRSTDLARLEKLADMPMWIDRPLDKPITLKAYGDPDDVVARRGGFGSRMLAPGERASFFLAGPDGDQVPKKAAPGDRLVGTLTLGQKDDSLPGLGQRPGGWPLTFVVPPRAVPDKEPSASDDEPADKPGPLAELADELRDARIARLGTWSVDDEAFGTLRDQLLAEFPEHLPLHQVLLERLDQADERRARLDEIIAACTRLLERIDRDALARHFGTEVDGDDPTQKAARKRFEEQREILTDTLYRQGRALWYRLIDEDGRLREDLPEADQVAARMEQTIAELDRWVDLDAPEYVLLKIARARLHGRLGTAVSLLNKRIDHEAERRLYEKRARLFDQLGWSHWAAYERNWLLIRYPDDYQPF